MEDRYDPMASDLGMYIQSKFLEVVYHKGRRFDLIVGEFGVLVKRPSPFDDLGQEGGGLFAEDLVQVLGARAERAAQ
jgi:hypothetical protein